MQIGMELWQGRGCCFGASWNPGKIVLVLMMMQLFYSIVESRRSPAGSVRGQFQ